MKCYQKNYPRPQFVRPATSWNSLNGTWDFAYDATNQGEKKGWQQGFEKTHDITVPFAPESPASGIGEETPCPAVWYKRTLTADTKTLSKRRLLLHFEGSDYVTKVWINGQFVGSHTGGYSRFSFDITPFMTDGDNTLVIKAEDLPNPAIPRGKQRWTDYNFGCWYIQTTGIWKTVWTETVAEEYILSVKMTPQLAARTLALEWDVEGDYDGDLALEATITYKDTFVNRTRIPVTARQISTTMKVESLAVSEWGLHAWSPENPSLYDIEFTLLRNNKEIDTVGSYFGMREIRTEDGLVLLNGRPLYQRMLLDQGYWEDSHLTPPSEEAIITDIDRTLEFGFNGIRKHQKIEDERFLYWCDVKGVLVWSEMAAAYTFNDFAVQCFTTEWMDIVKQNYNHPSIITWVPFNESWGVPQIKTEKTQQSFVNAIYHLTKAFDPMRPVVTNDGWEHTISDIITLHDYVEEGDELWDRYTTYLDDILCNEQYHNLDKSAFAGDYGYHGQPIILSEYGGIAFASGEEGWGYGNKVTSAAEYIKRYESVTIAVKENPMFCGYCYTQTTDVQQEINGVMNMKREPKVDPAILKEINLRDVSSNY